MHEFLERMLKMFRSAPNIEKMGFLSSFFVTEDEDIVDTEMVSIDIVRTDEDVAPVLRDLKTGAVAISEDLYTNKAVKPPVYSLERPVGIFELMKKQPGETEYAAIGSWIGRLMIILKDSFVKMTNMIKYSIELQASQVLQTGQLSLTDEKGVAAYTLDYKPKATHFPSVTTAWTNGAGNPIGDINALMDVIRDDGLVDVANVIFGKTAWNDFMANADVKEALRRDGTGLGAIDPKLVGKGGKHMGFINIGSYRVELFTYNGSYKAFGSATKARFVGDNKVILLPDLSELDFRLVFGGIPSIGVEAPFDQFLPERVSVNGAFDFRPRVYRDQKGDTWVGEIKSRPICIPVSIDRFGCLTTR
jgi:hypothetical protein